MIKFFAFAAFFCLVPIAQAECLSPSFVVDTFVARWNQHVTDRKLTSSWLLPRYRVGDLLKDGLGEPGFVLRAKVDRSGCINRVSIRSSRAEANGYAALVAWLLLVKATAKNPRKELFRDVISALRLDSVDAGGEFIEDGVVYEFREDQQRNEFSVYPEQP